MINLSGWKGYRLSQLTQSYLFPSSLFSTIPLPLFSPRRYVWISRGEKKRNDSLSWGRKEKTRKDFDFFFSCLDRRRENKRNVGYMCHFFHLKRLFWYFKKLICLEYHFFSNLSTYGEIQKGVRREMSFSPFLSYLANQTSDFNREKCISFLFSPNFSIQTYC